MKTHRDSTHILLASDLDGTLLQEETYDCAEALPLLRFLTEKGIPVILASSKTRREMEEIQEDLGIEDPFICENGGAVVIPSGYFPNPTSGAVRDGEKEVLELGCPIGELEKSLHRLAKETHLQIRTLPQMDVDEVCEITGLSREQAALARRRNYDLPFAAEGPGSSLEALRQKAERLGLRVIRGGRLVHLTGDIDKGKAFSRLLTLYRSSGQSPFVVALGDAENDLGLLQAADLPIVIPKRSGWDKKLIGLPRVRLASRPSPQGWVEEVRAALREQGLDPP